MSALTEYLKLLPRGLKDIDNVIKGIVNDVKLQNGTLSDEVQKTIIERRLICHGCPYNSVLARTSEEYKALYGENYTTNRPDFHCSICGCPLATRTASLDKHCGLEYYNDLHPENKQELKW